MFAGHGPGVIPPPPPTTLGLPPSAAVPTPPPGIPQVSHIQASGATQRVLQRLQAKDSAAQQAAKAQKAEQKKALAAVFSAYGAEDDPKAEAEGPKADADGPAQPEPEPPAAAAAAPSAPAAAPAPADKNAPKKIAYKPEQAPEDRKVLYTTLPQGPQFVAASFTTTAATPLRKNRQVGRPPRVARAAAARVLRCPGLRRVPCGRARSVGDKRPIPRAVTNPGLSLKPPIFV